MRTTLQWCAGLFFGFRICITYLGFQVDPRTGSAVTLALSGCLFAAALIDTFGDTTFSMSTVFHGRTMRWLLAYIVLAGASVAWTQAESSSVAAGYWAGMAADVATVALLLRGVAIQRQLDAMMRGFVVGTLVVALVAWLSPTLPDMRIGNEDFLHPNGLGLEFALAFFMAQHLTAKNRHWRWAAIALGVSLLRTISKTSIIACMVAECFYLLRERQMSRRIKVQIALAASVVIAAFWGLLEAYFSMYTANGDQAETLTGRTTIWALSFLMAMERPWVGHGLYSYRALIPAFGTFEPWHAHNELLQQFFELGLFGVVVTAGLYLALWRAGGLSAKNHPDWPYGKLAAVLVLFSLVHGLTDTVNFGLSLPLWLFVGLAIATDQVEVTA